MPLALEISGLPGSGPRERATTDAEYPPVALAAQRFGGGAGAGGGAPLQEQPCVLARGVGSAPLPLK